MSQKVAIGGKAAYKEYEMKGINVIFQWVALPVEGEGEFLEPCMILIRPHSTRRGAWVIPLDAAWKYNEPGVMVQQCRQAALSIGLDDSMMDTLRVIDVVQNYLEELVKMPPAPDDYAHKITMGELQLFIQGEHAATRLVMSDGSVR